MSTTEPGASLPKLAEPDRRYFAWRTRHPHEAEDPSLAWAEAWRQAYWAGIRENSQLGLQLLGVVQRVEALEQHLRDLEVNANVERELENGSAYWADLQSETEAVDGDQVV